MNFISILVFSVITYIAFLIIKRKIEEEIYKSAMQKRNERKQALLAIREKSKQVEKAYEDAKKEYYNNSDDGSSTN